MTEINAAVKVFIQPSALLSTIRSLCNSGFDPRKLSVVARHFRTRATVRDPTGAESGSSPEVEPGTFWEAIQMLQPGCCFQVSNLGVVRVAGPLARWIDAALSNEALFAGLSPVGAGLCSIGIPRSMAPFYEADLRAGRLLLIVHGPTRDVEWARSIMDDLMERGDRDSTSSSFRGHDRT
jgi:hypothetical protein